MYIYIPVHGSGYELCQPINPADYDMIYDLIDGTRRAGTWTPLRMRFIHDDEGEELRESDAPWLDANALIFRKRAITALAGCSWITASSFQCNVVNSRCRSST